MFTVRSRLIVSAAVCGVVATLVAAPASARPADRAGSVVRFGIQSGHASPLARSRYLAGYRATDPHHVSGVVIKAVDVPQASCSGTRFDGVALGGGSEPVLGEVEYFAGIYVTCASGQAQYLLEAVDGNGDEQSTGIEPGDQAQIVITVHCDSYPTCDVFSSATSIDTDASVSVETTIDLTTDSALFGAFPLFRAGSARPAPVPAFGHARIIGCLFGNHLIGKGTQRLTRYRQGAAEIRPGKIDVGSFTVRRPS